MEPCGHRCFHSVTALFRLVLEQDELGRGVLLGGFGVLEHLVAYIVYGLDYLVKLLVTQAAEMVKAPVKHGVDPVFYLGVAHLAALLRVNRAVGFQTDAILRFKKHVGMAARRQIRILRAC